MASVSIILWNEPDAAGSYPVAIRISKKKDKAYIFLESIKRDDWDEDTKSVKKTHPNSRRLNNLILKKFNDANNTIIDFETKGKSYTVRAVKNIVQPAAGPTFAEQGNLYLQKMKKRDYNQYTANKPRILLFKKFVKGNIAMTDITPSLLLNFADYVRAKKQVKERTVMNYLSAIRSVFASAVTEYVISRDDSPFGRNGIVIKFPESVKIGLNSQEVGLVENVELKGQAHHARNLWLTSFYFAGARVSDVLRLRWSDIQDGRLYYMMGKNQKVDSLKVSEKAMRIINQYRELKENKDDFIFPELKGIDLNDQFMTKKTISYAASATDKLLKKYVATKIGIEKKLTMHIARHSFAQISSDRIPIQILQKLYRHNSIITTIGYQSHFTHKDKDDALDKVLNL